MKKNPGNILLAPKQMRVCAISLPIRGRFPIRKVKHLYAHTNFHIILRPLLQRGGRPDLRDCLAVPAWAKRAVPENLGNGLDKLVESNVATKAGAPANFNGCAGAGR